MVFSDYRMTTEPHARMQINVVGRYAKRPFSLSFALQF